MTLLTDLTTLLGDANVLTGEDMSPYISDWIGRYHSTPLAVLRPGSTEDVSAIAKLAHASQTPLVPVGGNTGLAGGTHAASGLMISMERMTAIRDIRPDARVAIVEAGVVLSALHEAAAEHDLVFPLTFGARGSARVGGFISTNAGGSNVVRYGNTRDLVLGLEIVLADGRVMDLMTELHKDNSGYNLKHLFIGAEGTLGIITAAVLKLKPRPAAYATAMVAPANLSGALSLLNRLQSATGGAVEAFEYMPRSYMDEHNRLYPDVAHPFEKEYDINILLEVGATADRDAKPLDDGSIPIQEYMMEVLAEELDSGAILDATVAQSDAQRAVMWARREAAAEVVLRRMPLINHDIAVPLDAVDTFLTQADAKMQEMDPGFHSISVSHLGDGNVHYSVFPTSDDAQLTDDLTEAVEDIVRALGGSFSAEHGIGLTKKPSMERRKDTIALDAMRAVKAALDPLNLMNPGKVLPEA